MARRRGPNSDPTVQGKLRNREKLVENQRRADLKEVMSIAGGRRFMYGLIFGQCGIMGIYPGSDSGIYRNEGRRQLGVEIAADLQTNHEAEYLLMITEQLAAQKNEKIIAEAAIAAQETEDDNDD